VDTVHSQLTVAVAQARAARRADLCAKPHLPANLRASSCVLVAVAAATAFAGAAREATITWLFGGGSTVDAFAFALAIIQTMHGLVFVGALGDGVIPVLAQADSRGPHGSDTRLVCAAAWTVGVAGLILAAAILAALPVVFDVLVPHTSGLDRGIVITLAWKLAWLLPANALVTLFTLVLTARRKFVAAVLPFLCSHLLFIATASLLAPTFGPPASGSTSRSCSRRSGAAARPGSTASGRRNSGAASNPFTHRSCGLRS
jgi:peptidoglycan biosynthesis protein MviN/MurJ (putative lipid II flippase)